MFPWNSGEPNNADLAEDCVESEFTFGFPVLFLYRLFIREERWNDFECDLGQRYVCRKQCIVTASSSSPSLSPIVILPEAKKPKLVSKVVIIAVLVLIIALLLIVEQRMNKKLRAFRI